MATTTPSKRKTSETVPQRVSPRKKQVKLNFVAVRPTSVPLFNYKDRKYQLAVELAEKGETRRPAMVISKMTLVPDMGVLDDVMLKEYNCYLLEAF